jgi:hypothetical protein
MAAGAVVTIQQSWDLPGNRTEYLGTIALGSSHLAAGDAIDVANNERFAWLNAVGGGTTASGGGYVYGFDQATQKLFVYYGDNNNASDGPLIAVPDGDLSAATAVPFRALSD